MAIVERYVVSNPLSRQVDAKIWVVADSETAPEYTFTNKDYIKSIEIQRTGEDNKFFGFGIAQSIKLVLVNEGGRNIKKGYFLLPKIGNRYFTAFKIDEVVFDKVTKETTITGHDLIQEFNNHTISDIYWNMEGESGFTAYNPSTVLVLIEDLVSIKFFGGTGFTFGGAAHPYTWDNAHIESLDFVIPDYGLNLSGTETCREVANAAAEMLGIIYFMEGASYESIDSPAENEWEIYTNVFCCRATYNSINRAITIEDTEMFSIEMDETCYFANNIYSVTELGDNYKAGTYERPNAIDHYLRENPLINHRDDAPALLDALQEATGGAQATKFICEYRSFTDPIGEVEISSGMLKWDDYLNRFIWFKFKGATDIKQCSHIWNETLTYDGGLRSKIWTNLEVQKAETEANPTSLGDVLKTTYARVDKANQNITLLASDIEGNSSKISSLELTTSEISATVSKTSSDVEGLTEKVNMAMTAEDVKIAVSTQLGEGVNAIRTETGFTFDNEGLTISKTGSEMTTQVTEDGMTVYRDNTEVLVANNQGVVARNLHAETYLIVGDNSRFEDYVSATGESRTGCFWIGG